MPPVKAMSLHTRKLKICEGEGESWGEEKPSLQWPPPPLGDEVRLLLHTLSLTRDTCVPFCSDLCLKRRLKHCLTSFPTFLFPTTLPSPGGGALTWERSIWNQVWLGIGYHIPDAPAYCCPCVSHVLWEYQPDWVLRRACHRNVSGCELHLLFSVKYVPRLRILVELRLAAVLEISRSPHKNFKGSNG